MLEVLPGVLLLGSRELLVPFSEECFQALGSDPVLVKFVLLLDVLVLTSVNLFG